MRAFEPLRRKKFESAATKSYLEAFAKLESDDAAAMAAFAAHGMAQAAHGSAPDIAGKNIANPLSLWGEARAHSFRAY